MINYQTITIDLQPDYREPVVQMYLSESDVGRPIQVNVLMQGQPYSFIAGTTVHIDLRKPSGRVVQVNGNYAVGSNVVLFNVVKQMAAEPGVCLTELSIVGDGQDPIGSKNWLTKVELSPMHAGDPSETWIEDLDELVQDAMEGHIDATLSIPGDAADAAAVGEELADLKSALEGTKSSNLFDRFSEDVDSGKYYTSTGEKASSNSWSAVKIQVGEYDQIEYSGLTAEGGNAVVSCWFDSNLGFLSYFKQHTGENTITVPANAEYVGLSINRNDTVLSRFTVYGINLGVLPKEIDDLRDDVDDLRNDVDDLDTDVTALSAQVEAIDPAVPDYYATHIATKAGSVIANMNACGAEGETFIFITDPHWETNNHHSPALVRYLLDHTKISQIYCGGDLINQGTDKAELYAVMIDFIRTFQLGYSGYFLPIARGNHDDNSNWSTSTDIDAYSFDYSTVFSLLYKDIADKVTFLRPGVEFSFYFDRIDTKTRYIFLDTRRNGTLNVTTALKTLLNDTPVGYNIVFIAHYLYNGSVFTSGATLLFNMIAAFNGKTTGSYAGVTFDFTNSNGKAICVIGGHTHADYQWSKDDQDNISGVPVILTDTDSTRNLAAVDGTTDAQCFDVITIDYTAKKVKCVRVGRGSDRTFDFD